MFDESLAADAATPCEKLFELANSSQLVIARIVAANSSISPDVVAALQLRKDEKINHALAANPATPVHILYELGVRYTSEFVHNPIFKMEQISDPFFLTHLPGGLLKNILTHESTPEYILLWACEHRGVFDFAKDDTVEGWLISSPRSMLIVCSKLSIHIRVEIAQREHLPQEMVCALAADEDVNVRLTIAGRHDLSETFVRQLSNDPDADIRHLLAQLEHLPQEIACALAADDDVNVRRAVAWRHDLWEPVLRQLSNDADAGIRKQIAQRARLSQEIVFALATDQDVSVRLEIAWRHDLSDPLLGELSNDRDAGIRLRIAQRHHLPQEIVDGLAADHDVTVCQAAAVRTGPAYLARDLYWAIVLAEKPDESVITNSDFRDRIIATALPWRVRDKGTKIEMLLIPPGRFMMGACPEVITDGIVWPRNRAVLGDEVFINNPFYLGRTPVTQAQWQKTRGSNPSHFSGETNSPVRPVEQVSWNMIQQFNWVTGLRLPTEAEWEYCCRGGTTTPQYGLLDDIAWYQDNSGFATHVVATKRPNALGLYDMLGNVWEWCADENGEYSSGSLANPKGPLIRSYQVARFSGDKVMRGGFWFSGAKDCCASQNFFDLPDRISCDIGFRVARNP